ncbi:methyltransferase domain-containing protein [Pontixanthobacter aquaemixtae]|uniref:Methyltransferase domain-containing protein n=1 Tax=Pontixanthobacter aquaemixtae TaxID=1958940 RepID=A0A844ZSW0_9SPHN|nr:methyltransferase domain-containing protein [Pontixanthobacter aquaemixtae]MXO90210.1 methyltransferase domain-containing protein [Pontixanthobacter aquaemixtae]
MNKAPPAIFSRNRCAAKWGRARARYKCDNSSSFLLDDLTGDVIERVGFMQLQPQRALVVGDWSDSVATALSDLGADIAVGQLGHFNEELPAPAGSRFDLIVHLMGLGMVNDLPGALIHARATLAEGGVFIAAFPGAGSLSSLRNIALAADGERPAPRIHPMIDSASSSALLQRAGFGRQVVDSHTLSVRYRSLGQLVSDLRDHGLTASLEKPSPALGRQWLSRAQEAFDTLRDEDGKVTENFEMMTLTAWK